MKNSEARFNAFFTGLINLIESMREEKENPCPEYMDGWNNALTEVEAEAIELAD